ncbi:MAG: ABC transporter ATP-binding protein [Omnitrophica bacterium]|nr:ABC transporter ATP-binding protein [Candidatus Omnitrophota bacterium]
MSLLRVNNLSTSFFIDAGEVEAVRGLSFSIDEGQTLGLVGESGCGKSVTALSILGLVPYPGKIVEGEILYKEKDICKFSDKELQQLRGSEISLIFQEPLTALNPVFTIGEQIIEGLMLHQKLEKNKAIAKTIELLVEVGIADSEKRLKDYPHQLSGGMRQRVMIAMALSCNPSLLIADEPTTALDVTIQAQILELIARIQKEKNMAMILITHDLGIIANTVDNVAIMYSGKIVEYSTAQAVINEPLHPYTLGLLASVPSLEEDANGRLKTIPGLVPNLLNLPSGCAFCERCDKADSECRKHQPELIEVKSSHWVSCHKVK